MGDEARFDGGPERAIEEFLAGSGGRYVIEERYCDRFGHNVTGNPNGYLRRVKPAQAGRGRIFDTTSSSTAPRRSGRELTARRAGNRQVFSPAAALTSLIAFVQPRHRRRHGVAEQDP